MDPRERFEAIESIGVRRYYDMIRPKEPTKEEIEKKAEEARQYMKERKDLKDIREAELFKKTDRDEANRDRRRTIGRIMMLIPSIAGMVFIFWVDWKFGLCLLGGISAFVGWHYARQ